MVLKKITYIPVFTYDPDGYERFAEPDYNSKDYKSELEYHKDRLKVFNAFNTKLRNSDLSCEYPFNPKYIKKDTKSSETTPKTQSKTGLSTKTIYSGRLKK